MNELMLNFEFGENPVRTIAKSVDEIWFIGKDVAIALGHTNPERAIRKFVDDEDKGVTVLVTPGGQQEVMIINEPGVYSLVFASQTENAKQFKRWVTHDVLPSIRKKGYFSLMPDEQLAALLDEQINRSVDGKRLLRESREQRTVLLDLERNKISHENYVMQLRCIWGEDSYGFHKAFNEYLSWYNQVGRRLQGVQS